GIEATAAKSVGALVDTHTKLRGEIEQSHAGLHEGIRESAARSVDTLLNTHERVRGEVDQASSVLQQSIESTIAKSVEALVGTHGRLRSEVEQSSSTLLENIEASATRSLESLTGAHERLRGEVERSSSILRTEVETSASQSVASLAGVNDALSGIVGRLADANLSLQDILASVGGNLSNVEGALAQRLKEFQSALGTISSQVISLQRTSSATMTDANALVEKLARNGQDLATATAELQRSHSEVGGALDERRGVLERLLNDVGSRTEDFDRVMRAFTKMVEASFENAESRARDIGTFLSNASQATAGEISDQFEIIRATTGRERERTAEALRAAYEQANAEMSELLQRATDQFRGTLDEMRDIAAQVRRELDATQQELRRGALELPKETSEQASAMRRVIADQIKALNELTDIVTRSGRAFDVVDPAAAPTRRPPEPPPARSAEPRNEPRQAAEPIAMRSQEPQAPRREEAKPAPEAQPRRDEAVRPRAPSRPAPAQQQTADRRQGWLSDLLARASREDAPEPPRATPQPSRSATQTIESLDSISLDIARMIDHDASVELWDRYRRGERNVFTRRLYTAHGQQSFDEIRRRYRADDEFRATVDRYTQEFERLLNEVSRDDRDGLLAKTYLTSETGKVYTMLAHASGRLQ
ncbi:MAG: apolipoprotein acyltransferase, partial [Methylobacteriaceae bacterium]|nr:apolipoprotein acyltransferase [Methylobacteriaceae bacterium]